MKPPLLLRIASMFTLLLGLGHSMGFPWTPDHTPQGAAVVEQMKNLRVDAIGFRRSYFDFYIGFGITCGLGNIIFAIVLWQLGSMAKIEPAKTRPMAATLFVAFTGFAIIDCLYFFTAPLVLTVPVVICTGLAIALAGSVPAAEAA